MQASTTFLAPRVLTPNAFKPTLKPIHKLTMSTSSAPSKMRATFMDRYGPPRSVLHLKEVSTPALSDDNVLIRIQASSVHGGDWRAVRGAPWFIRPFFGGLFRPSKNIPGSDLAGVVQAVGKNVTEFKQGDDVFGDVSDIGWGAWAEFISVPATAVIKRPKGVGVFEAAVTAVSGIPALQAVRDHAKVQKGMQVLVNGASGGVGHFAVQIAKAFGANVTAVCHKDKMDVVSKCGADRVVDYTQTDVLKEDIKYDAVIDTAAFVSPWQMVPIVKEGGRYVLVGGDMGRLFETAIWGGWISRKSGVQVGVLETKVNRESLNVLGEMLEDGRVKPCLDKVFGLDEVPEAVEWVEGRKVKGKVVIKLTE